VHRYAIFVDAGYLYSQALQILSGKPKSERSQLSLVDPAALMAELTNQAQSAFGHDRLLRTYWYDGVAANFTPEQTSIAVLPDVQFRAGTIHNRKQKGVDSRIVHDLFELASNHAIADAMVVTGDGDIAVGIEFAQRRGMRVALMSVEDVPNGVSANRHAELSYLADRQLTIGRNEVQKLFRYTAKPALAATASAPVLPASAPTLVVKSAPAATGAAVAAPAVAKPSIDDDLRQSAEQLVAEIPETSRSATLNNAGGIVAAIDKQLLDKARHALGRTLAPDERAKLRKCFVAAIKKGGK
jgi:uncharacterized LabA/DUF88 family protein